MTQTFVKRTTQTVNNNKEHKSHILTLREGEDTPQKYQQVNHTIYKRIYIYIFFWKPIISKLFNTWCDIHVHAFSTQHINKKEI